MEVEAAARAYESGLVEDVDRRSRGAFYTPDHLVAWILDRALAQHGSGPAPADVLDPACGTGHFLVEAAQRLGDARAVWGSDTDPEAVAHARRRLAALDPSLTDAELAERIRVADGLTVWRGRRFAAVVGNPPFLGQLRRRTAGRTAGRAGGSGAGSGAGSSRRLGAYTDTSAAFLHHALDLCADGGVVALVQPLSVLAARDAGPVRAQVAARGTIEDFWCAAEPVFAGTPVLTCVPVVRIGDGGARGSEAGIGAVGPDDWGRLAAPTFGLPAIGLDDLNPTEVGGAAGSGGAGVLGDLADCTADFRDQYYGLIPFVRDRGADREEGTPLITTGLLEPLACRWGRAPTRFARTRYDAPLVDLAALAAAGGPLAAWAARRLVPKVVLAGQGRVLEAAVDVDGSWLPSVPVVSIVPRASDRAQREDDLWRLIAVLSAPPVVAGAAVRWFGTGLAPGSVKVSARQVAGLPLPADHAAWADGARLCRAAQLGPPSERAAALTDLADTMTHAYGLRGDRASTIADWWLRRVGP